MARKYYHNKKRNAALLYEFLVGGVRGYNEISRVTGSAPLVVVPMLNVSEKELNRTTSRYTKLYWLIGVGLLLLVGFHYLIMDFETLWSKLLRKISLL